MKNHVSILSPAATKSTDFLGLNHSMLSESERK